VKAPRILVVTGGFPVRSETFIRDHVTGLLDAGAEVTVLALHDGDGSAWDEDELRLGLSDRVRRARIAAPLRHRLFRMPARFLAHASYALGPAWRLVTPKQGWRGPSGILLEAASALGAAGAPHQFDRIHAEFGPSGVVAAKLRRAGCIAGPLSCAFYGYDATRAIMQSGPGLYRELFEDADLVLPNSEFLAQKLRQAGAPTSKVIVHRLGVRTDRFAPAERPAPRPGPWRATAIGRFVPKKGFTTLLHALARAGEAAPELTLIGDGPMSDELRALTTSLGLERSVRFAGWLGRQDVLAHLAATDALIAPSETAEDGDIEGMPVVVMEAMASGIPIIGTDHSGIPEIVRDGINGVIVPERDPAGLAQAMLRLSDPGFRRACGAQSRSIAVSELDHAMLMRRLIGLLFRQPVAS